MNALSAPFTLCEGPGMDTNLSHYPPTTEEEYKQALTDLTQSARENGVAVNRVWCCTSDADAVAWDVEVIPLTARASRD